MKKTASVFLLALAFYCFLPGGVAFAVEYQVNDEMLASAKDDLARKKSRVEDRDQRDKRIGDWERKHPRECVPPDIYSSYADFDFDRDAHKLSRVLLIALLSDMSKAKELNDLAKQDEIKAKYKEIKAWLVKFSGESPLPLREFVWFHSGLLLSIDDLVRSDKCEQNSGFGAPGLPDRKWFFNRVWPVGMHDTDEIIGYSVMRSEKSPSGYECYLFSESGGLYYEGEASIEQTNDSIVLTSLPGTKVSQTLKSIVIKLPNLRYWPSVIGTVNDRNTNEWVEVRGGI